MNPRILRSSLPLLAAAAMCLPQPSAALAPALLLMIKQIVQQTATSMFKDAVLSGLRDMGCKGMAIANALEAADLRGAVGGPGTLMGGLPKIPAGMAMPTMPTMPGLPGMPAMPGMPGIPGMGTGLPAGLPPDLAAKMRLMLPGTGQLPPGMGLDGDQQAMMARMQQAMAEPLSPPETLATIDALHEVGFLPKAIQGELKECMLLVPASIPALGMGMGMLRPVIPQLRQARKELHALSPAEQDEVAAAMVQQIKPLPADERQAVVEQLDGGFFPPRVSQRVKAALVGP